MTARRGWCAEVLGGAARGPELVKQVDPLLGDAIEAKIPKDHADELARVTCFSND
jgi:hypothetical protein